MNKFFGEGSGFYAFGSSCYSMMDVLSVCATRVELANQAYLVFLPIITFM